MKTLICICTVTLLLNTQISCKKTTTEYQKKVGLITNQSWILISIRENTNNGSWIDRFSSLPLCQKDNRLFFRSDYTFNWDEGQTKCNNSDPQTFYYGNWSLSSNEENLITTFSGVSSETQIYLLDNSNLITIKRGMTGLDSFTVESKYVH